MDKERTAAPPQAVELDRTQTRAHIDVLWSNGRKVRIRTFGELDHRPLDPQERAARRRAKRARKVARAAKGNALKARMQQHGLQPRAIRFVRQR
jgi:hypothetical protein